MGHLLDLPTGTRLYRLDNNKVKVEVFLIVDLCQTVPTPITT